MPQCNGNECAAKNDWVDCHTVFTFGLHAAGIKEPNELFLTRTLIMVTAATVAKTMKNTETTTVAPHKIDSRVIGSLSQANTTTPAILINKITTDKNTDLFELTLRAAFTLSGNVLTGITASTKRKKYRRTPVTARVSPILTTEIITS